MAGGADSLCGLTTNGFHALQALAASPSNPFSVNRDGLTLGEGAAMFLLTRDPGGIQLVGAGEASDAFHMSAPDPEGAGAEMAMRAALQDAAMPAAAVSYLNLHGTGTPLNDAMESAAVHRIFGATLACSSTKPLVGHTLGAAGALEAGVLLDDAGALARRRAAAAAALLGRSSRSGAAPLRFARVGDAVALTGRALVMSNSFGFGGNNCALLLGADER